MSDAQVKGIQRYDFRRCKLHFDPHVCLCGKQARPEGEFVTFADHEQALAALEAERDEFKHKCEELCCAHGSALIEIHRGWADALAALEAEKERAEAANELDRRSLFAVVRSIDEEITGRMWLIEGRGCYEWDDDTYRKEFGWAVNALQQKLEPLRKIAGDLTNCPATEKGVNSVRKLEQQVAALEARNRELADDVDVIAECDACPLCRGRARVIAAKARKQESSR